VQEIASFISSVYAFSYGNVLIFDYFLSSAFLAVYEELTSEIIEKICPQYDVPQESINYQKELIEYNVPGGKLNRGLTVVHIIQTIRGDKLTDTEAKQAAILGWALEWLQAFFLVADDVMDGSITRRGQPCWYKLSHVGMTAINDGFLLLSHVYKILKLHFGKDPNYGKILELFNEVTWQTELGQLLDLTTQPLPAAGPIDLDRFTLQRYKQIVKYKTAYYSFYLPVACGVILAGLDDEASLKKAENILVVMGEYFQIQDDYLDAYAPPEILGKIGTDIQDNKCSWLVVQALQLANQEQKALLKANYGKHDPECVKAVKNLYHQLELEKLFLQYEQDTYKQLRVMIDEATVDGKIPAEVYLSLLHKIYKRSK
jgi:farnesyl diphosphate synthase